MPIKISVMQSVAKQLDKLKVNGKRTRRKASECEEFVKSERAQMESSGNLWCLWMSERQVLSVQQKDDECMCCLARLSYDRVKVFLLPLNAASELTNRSKFHRLFNVVYISNRSEYP